MFKPVMLKVIGDDKSEDEESESDEEVDKVGEAYDEFVEAVEDGIRREAAEEPASSTAPRLPRGSNNAEASLYSTLPTAGARATNRPLARGPFPGLGPAPGAKCDMIEFPRYWSVWVSRVVHAATAGL